MRYFIVFLLAINTASAVIFPKVIESKKGIKAWFVQDKKTNIISLDFAFKDTGSISDSSDKVGRSEMAVQMMFKGAGAFSKDGLNKYQEDNGISFDGVARLESVYFSLQVLNRKKHEGIKLVKTILHHPTFPGKEWNLMKEKEKISLANSKHDPGYQIQKEFFKNFTGHPYQNTYGLTEETLNQLELEDFKEFKEEFLTKNRLIVALNANMSEKQAKDFLDEIFEDLPTHPLTKVKSTSLKNQGKEIKIQLNIPQINVYLYQEGISIEDDNFLPFYMFMQVLGSGELTSRLMKNIREKEGLVYGISASPNPMKYCPIIEGSFEVSKEKLDKTIELLKKEWKNLQKDGLTEEELKKVKNKMIGSYPLGFQSSRSISSTMLYYQSINRPIDYFQKREEMIKNITLDQINNLAKEIIDPKKLSFIIVGPKESKS